MGTSHYKTIRKLGCVYGKHETYLWNKIDPKNVLCWKNNFLDAYILILIIKIATWMDASDNFKRLMSILKTF